MHVIHHTEAVILKSTPSGEANRRVWLFTREFGLIVALVQGVRKSGAKLQSHVGDYSFIKADLIRGREVWRLVSGSVLHDPLVGLHRTPLARAYVRSLSLLTRFLIDEGSHPELYDHIKECAEVLTAGHHDAKIFDALSLWKILGHLGYIAPSPDEAVLLERPLLETLGTIDTTTYRHVLSAVENAIKESHL